MITVKNVYRGRLKNNKKGAFIPLAKEETTINVRRYLHYQRFHYYVIKRFKSESKCR